MINLHSLFLLLFVGNSITWKVTTRMDGCIRDAWRCGDICVAESAACKCGEATFRAGDHKWCCEDAPCTGKGKLGSYSYNSNTYYGGAQCDGRPLNLTEPCLGGCNFYKEVTRNVNGDVRGYIPCNINSSEITQCIREHDVRDGKFDCKNRADEEPFATGFEDTSSLLNDLDGILLPCKTGSAHRAGLEGFICKGYIEPLSTGSCLETGSWCSSSVYSCDELVGKTATGTTIDHQLCSNQSFWEGKSCDGEQYY